MGTSKSIYFDGTYLDNNPDWDRKDAPWKAKLVASMLSENNIIPSTVCEVGCGAGDILLNLKRSMPTTAMVGYDISPSVVKFWNEKRNVNGIEYILGDFHVLNKNKHDVLLMLDVFEHIRDPYSFLENSRQHADFFIFHVPLELSVSTIIREYTLINARNKVGHLHHYTKNLAIAVIIESGYNILDLRYTGASLNAPERTIGTRFANIFRRIAYGVNRDLGVRLLGGDTLLILAQVID
jgi:hypothetical protein